MGWLIGKESRELVIQSAWDFPSVSDRITATSKWPSVIGKTILPEWVRNSEDLIGIVPGEILDILSQTKSVSSKAEWKIIDGEFTVIPDKIPKISN